jgi:hypothetical protein
VSRVREKESLQNNLLQCNHYLRRRHTSSLPLRLTIGKAIPYSDKNRPIFERNSSTASTMVHTGACACGAVAYTIQQELKSVMVCHCLTCQAWSGGIALLFEAAGSNVQIDGRNNLTTWTSSEYSERAFCKICGSSVYIRTTAKGPMENVHHVAAGTLQNWDGIDHIESEIFSDRKPSVYKFLDDQSAKMTSTEFYEMVESECISHDKKDVDEENK